MKKNLLACLTLITLSGCNNSSSDSTVTPANPANPANPATYQFIDEPVKGLFYQTATQSGCTDENGQYKALRTEEVRFYLGKCDDENKAIASDTNSIQVGFVAMPSDVTTPYDLKIKSGSSTVDVNPISIATIMKSLNRSDGNTLLDLTGIKFTGNGVDIKADFKSVIDDPSKTATTVLKDEVFADLKLVNRDNQKAFKQTKFLDEATVKAELTKTLKDLSKTKAFTASEVAEKHIVSSDNTVYYFGPLKGTNYSASIGEHGTSGTQHTYSAETDFGTWGVLTKPFGQKGSIGDLYISNGITVEKVLAKSNDNWMVQKNDGSKTLEKWTKAVVVRDLTKLTGGYTSVKSSEYTYKYTIKIDNDQFTITQTNELKDPKVPLNYTTISQKTSEIILGKDHVKVIGSVLNYKIIPLESDGSKVALLVNAKSSPAIGDEYHLVDVLSK